MIIPVYRVTSSYFPIAATTTIEAGHCVTLDSNGYVTKKTGNSGNAAIGLCGDRNRASEAYEWVNRVSDSGNETAGSGMMTVYHSGGEFYVDVNDSAITTPQGSAITGVVASNATTTVGTLLYPDGTAGLLDSAQLGSDAAVGIVLEAAAALDSGIPGEYEPGSSVEYADDSVARTWVRIKLLI